MQTPPSSRSLFPDRIVPHTASSPNQAGCYHLDYLWVILTAAIAAGLLWTLDAWSAWLMALVALSTIPTRQVLMPAINATSDAGNLRAFRWLHGASVLITLLHIAATAAVLVRFVV